MTAAADRHLLFGLLALQNGLINQGQLVAAFQGWTLDKSRSLAEHLEARGDLDADDRVAVEALVARHLNRHGGDVEKSLAAVPAARSTQQSLVRIGDPDIEATLGHVASAHPLTREEDDDPERTGSISVGTATSDGQRFRVLRPHARGGLGAVFVALDAELNREVALKQILDHHADDPTSRQRFLIEAEITGGLEHPGIVPVYGLGTYGTGRPYYAMRFIRGDSLKEAIESFHGDETLKNDPGQRSLELRKLLRRFIDVCNAIGYAHSCGVLHRDIKPANIIVGKHGETLVVDWGLAKPLGRAEPTIHPEERMLVPSSASGSADTLPGSALGTPAYMSPEQARGEIDQLGPRSDVYSLGACLYCLLTGKPAFEGGDIVAISRAVQRGDFPSPRKLYATIDRALEAICLKAMSQNPEDRYDSCKSLTDDIERWMADEAVVAWREPWSRKLMRWLTRHRTGVTACAAAMLMALAGLVAVSGVQAQANGELKRVNKALSSANARVVEANSELREANENVTRANTDLQAANLRERERFNLAMDAIKLFHGEISKDLLLKQGQFQKLRGKLLRGAADFYGRLEGLLRQRTDAESRAALGRAYEELGELTFSIGDALAIYRKAIEVRRALAEGPGATDAIKLDLTRNLRSAGFGMEGMSDRPAARACYDEALAIVKTLRPADGMTEPVYLVAGRILQSIGWWYHASANEKESVIWLRRACETVEKGLASRPRGPVSAQDKEALLSLASMLHALSGPLNALGRAAESLPDQERALRISRELAATDPDDPQVRISHAVSYFNMGGSLRSQDRWSDALSAYRAGADIAGKLADEYPGIVDYRRFLAKCLGGCGDFAGELGRAEEAIADSRAAVAAWKKVVDDNPGRYGEPVDLGISYNRLGWLLFGLGRLDEALEQYEAARAVFQKLIDTYPPDVLARTRNELSNILINIAEIQRIQGRLAEARANCDEAIAMREAVVRDFPQVRAYRYRMCECRLRSGQVRLAAGDIPGAVAEFRLALVARESLPDRSGELGMFEAGCHAMLSQIAGMKGSGIPAGERQVEADKAMAVLRRVTAEGFRTPELHGESSLEPLRTRLDFQLLMMDVAFPARPFAQGD